MRFLSREHLTKRLRELRTGLQHAFAAQSGPESLSVEEAELMERMAGAIVNRGMAAPATVFLDSMGPMNFLGSQALHFLTPIVEFAFNANEVEQVARLLERRDTMTRLVALIEAKSSSSSKGAAAQ